MKKRILSLFLVVCLVSALLVLLPLNASAATSGTCGNNLAWYLDSCGTLTISGTGNMKNWSSYSSVPWHSSKSSIKSIIINNGVTSISNYAFRDCYGLESVTIGNGVTFIGYDAFYYCSNLKELIIGSSVENIGSCAFEFCRSLTSVTLPNSVTTIGNSAFSDCGLTSIVIPGNVTTIGDSAFSYCTALTNVSISGSVTTIGKRAFSGCSLNNIDVSASNSKYSSENGVLFNKDKTTLICYLGGSKEEYKIPSSVTNIESYAFSGCSLKSVVIPSSITGISERAFSECELTSVIIPTNVKSIGNYAFDGCRCLTSVIIENGVTSIGNEAFGGCGMSNITIPDSVTSIDDMAFCKCDNLTNATIGSGVKSMGGDVFYYCSGLTSIDVSLLNNNYSSENGVLFNKNKSILICYPRGKNGTYTIPSSVTNIGEAAFHNCDYLTSVIIPNSVTTIGDSAFDSCVALKSTRIGSNVINIGSRAFNNCRKLTSITIPDSVTSIGDYTFYFCSSLTNLTIGNGVTSIGKYLFDYCYSLAHITIGSGVTSISTGVFSTLSSLISITVSPSNGNYSSKDGVLFNKNKSTLICYPKGKNGTYTIPSSVTSIGNGAFYCCGGLTSITIPNSVTSIGGGTFRSCTGLTSITIPKSVSSIGDYAFYNCGKLTDVYYGGSKTEWEKISIDYDNEYLTNATIHYNSSSSGNNGVVKSNFATITYNGATYNLLTQPINIDKESGAEVSVKVNYKNITEDEKIYLSQNTDKFVEFENNVAKTIKPAEIFDTDKDIYVLVVNEKTGVSHSERTRLKIVDKTNSGELMPNGNIEGLNFKLGKKMDFTIPNTIPVFGGTEVKWDFGFIPISVEYDREDDNKINVVFGTNIAHSDGKKGSDKYFKDFNFKKYKEGIKKATSKQGRTLKQLRNDFKMSNAYKMNLFGGKVVGGCTGKPSFDFDVAGYAEAKIIDGKFTFVEGQLCLEAEVSYTYQGQLFIWVVPLYYEIGGGVGAGFEGDIINIDPNGFVPEFEAYLTAKIKAEIGAGLGVAKVATVGASGEGTLNLKSALHKEYSKAWAEGEADFNVKVLGKEVAKKVFAKGDFLIYETGNANGLIPDSAVTPLAAQNALYSQIDTRSVYENESREYSLSSTQWYGDMPPVSMFDTEYTSKNLRILAENVYTESAPIMCEIDGKKVIVMLWDNSERSDLNRTMLVYSVYDEAEKVWSAPEAVCDDGTADFYPCFNDGYLVWQNEKALLDDNMTLGEIAKLGEICVSKWNGSGFDAPVALTDNEALDTQPVVCASESEVSVIWTTNSENDILGLSGDNSVLKSSFEDSAWSKPQVIKPGLCAITSLSAGYADGKLNIAYVEDEDNDLETIDDRDISIISESGEYKLTENSVFDSNPQIKGNTIYYYSNGNIEYGVLGGEKRSTVFTEAKVGLSDNFTVCEGKDGTVAVLWAKSVDDATEIFSTMCKDGKWSGEIQISETGNRSKYPTAVLEDDGTVYIAYNNGVAYGDTLQNDLYVIDLVPSYDLSVSNAYIDEETMTVYAEVKNTGELNISSYTVSLLDGGINSQKTVTDGLKAGESAGVEIEYKKPDNLSKHSITLSVEMVDSGENAEYNTENNSAVLTVGNCDVEIADVQNHETMPDSVAVVTVANKGYGDTGMVTVCLHKDSPDGAVLTTKTVDNLSAGESAEVMLDYNIVENDNIKWCVTAEAENTEISLGNNDSYIINNYYSTLSDYKHEILRYEITEDKLLVNAYAENNTDTDLTAVSLLAVYASDGGLKAFAKNGICTFKNDSSSADFAIENYIYEKGDYVKLFWWRDLNALAPVCEEYRLTLTKE